MRLKPIYTARPPGGPTSPTFAETYRSSGLCGVQDRVSMLVGVLALKRLPSQLTKLNTMVATVALSLRAGRRGNLASYATAACAGLLFKETTKMEIAEETIGTRGCLREPAGPEHYAMAASVLSLAAMITDSAVSKVACVAGATAAGTMAAATVAAEAAEEFNNNLMATGH